MIIHGEKTCTCTKHTPLQLRSKRHNCEVHRYLRSGEAIYMVAGEPVRFSVVRK